MAEYLFDIKTKIDLIAASGSPISVEDSIFYTLNELPSSYQSFKTTVQTNLQPISLDDFYSLLCSEEMNQVTERNRNEGICQIEVVAGAPMSYAKYV